MLRQEGKYRHSLPLCRAASSQIRIDLRLFYLADGKLGIAVEGMDLLYLVPEEGKTIRMVQRIGKNIDDRPADGILPRGRYEVYFVEVLVYQLFLEFLIGNFIAHSQTQHGAAELLRRRHRFFQCLRISDDKEPFAAAFQEFSHGGRALYAQG